MIERLRFKVGGLKNTLFLFAVGYRKVVGSSLTLFGFGQVGRVRRRIHFCNEFGRLLTSSTQVIQEREQDGYTLARFQ